MNVQYEELFKRVLPVLQSKMEEFKHFGYDGITMEDLWNYCIGKKWRKKDIDHLRIYEVVGTIFSIKASEIVSHFQIQQFQQIQSTNFFKDFNQEDLKYLLSPESSIKKEE